MDGLLPLPTGQGTEVSCPFWDHIHTSLKSIKWVTGEGNWKKSQVSQTYCLRAQSCLAVTPEVHHTAGTRSHVNWIAQLVCYGNRHTVPNTHTVKPQQVINYWRKPSPRSINPLGYWKVCSCLYLDLVIIAGGCLLDGYPELPLTAQMSKPIENEMGWVGSRKVYNSESHLKKKRENFLYLWIWWCWREHFIYTAWMPACSLLDF